MTQHRTPTRTARTLRAALRSAVLLIAAVTSVGLLPAVAAAATPPTPDPATPSSITPTSAGPTSAGPTSAGPTSADPTSADPTSAGTAAPPSAGTGAQGRRVAVRPATQTVTEGRTAVFTASLTPPPTTEPPVMIHWQTAPAPTGPWTDLSGADGAVLTSTATRDMNGDLYRAVATTGHQSATSPPAILHVQPVPDPPTTAGPPLNCPTPPPPIEPSTSCPDPTHSTPPLLPTASSTAVTATSPTADAPTPANAASTPTTGATYGTVALPVLQLGQEQTATGHNFTPA